MLINVRGRREGLGERSQARHDNRCGDDGSPAPGTPYTMKKGACYMRVFAWWVFEQVLGINDTVNTGELDKTVLSNSPV